MVSQGIRHVPLDAKADWNDAINGLSWFKVQCPRVPTLNLERETLNRAEGDTLNFEP
jgi:hypothetical protein